MDDIEARIEQLESALATERETNQRQTRQLQILVLGGILAIVLQWNVTQLEQFSRWFAQAEKLINITSTAGLTFVALRLKDGNKKGA